MFCLVAEYLSESLELKSNMRVLDLGCGKAMSSIFLAKEFESVIPEELKPYWEPYLFTHHNPEWWSQLWNRSCAVTIQVVDTMPNEYDVWLKWDKMLKEAGILKRNGDLAMLEADGGNFTFTRVAARKN